MRLVNLHFQQVTEADAAHFVLGLQDVKVTAVLKPSMESKESNRTSEHTNGNVP